MALLYALIFVVLCAVVNRVRGSRPERGIARLLANKILCSLYIGTGSYFLLFPDYIVSLAVAGFWYLWGRFGWGLYMISFSGDLNTLFVRDKHGDFALKEGKPQLDSEIGFVERTADFVFKHLIGDDFRKRIYDYVVELDIYNIASDPINYKPATQWGFIAMSVRQAFLLPLFFFLGWYTQNWLIPLCGYLCAFMSGYAYYGFRHYYKNVVVKRHDEWLMSGFEPNGMMNESSPQVIKIPKGDPPTNRTLFYIESIVGAVQGFYIVLSYVLGFGIFS